VWCLPRPVAHSQSRRTPRSVPAVELPQHRLNGIIFKSVLLNAPKSSPNRKTTTRARVCPRYGVLLAIGALGWIPTKTSPRAFRFISSAGQLPSRRPSGRLGQALWSAPPLNGSNERDLDLPMISGILAASRRSSRTSGKHLVSLRARKRATEAPHPDPTSQRGPLTGAFRTRWSGFRPPATRRVADDPANAPAVAERLVRVSRRVQVIPHRARVRARNAVKIPGHWSWLGKGSDFSVAPAKWPTP
jgi:hypothetical protein